MNSPVGHRRVHLVEELASTTIEEGCASKPDHRLSASDKRQLKPANQVRAFLQALRQGHKITGQTLENGEAVSAVSIG